MPNGVGLRTEFRDPRFQRALLAERAARPFAALPTTGRATREFVERDLGTRLAFGRIGLSSRLADAQLRQQRFQRRMTRKGLRERERMLPIQLAVGGITSLLSLAEGRRRAGLLAEEAALGERRHGERMGMLRQIAAQGRVI